MRGRFIKMYIAPDNVLLTESFTHEPVHIPVSYTHLRRVIADTPGNMTGR